MRVILNWAKNSFPIVLFFEKMTHFIGLVRALLWPAGLPGAGANSESLRDGRLILNKMI